MNKSSSELVWRNGLSKGELVLIESTSRKPQLVRVVRTTLTQVIFKNDLRFRKKDGGKVGGTTWNNQFISKPTDEVVTKISLDKKRIKLLLEVQSVDFSSFNINQLEQVMKLISALKPLG